MEAIGSCRYKPDFPHLWSSRDLAAWGIARLPHRNAAHPEWATPRKGV
ncbi:hypothetical protein [Streptomyces sp. NPDC051310]